jgi:TPR repeat protein
MRLLQSLLAASLLVLPGRAEVVDAGKRIGFSADRQSEPVAGGAAARCVAVPRGTTGANRSHRLKLKLVRRNRAGHQGNRSGQFHLGLLYYEGRGVHRDYVEAARLIRMAADKEDVDAQIYLAEIFRAGRGVEADPVEAYMWYDIAAANDEDARKARDEIGAKLSRLGLVQGKRLAQDWRDAFAKRTTP